MQQKDYFIPIIQRIFYPTLNSFQLIRCPQTSRAHLIAMMFLIKDFVIVELIDVQILLQVHFRTIAGILVVSIS